jgi:hypothetical protein
LIGIEVKSGIRKDHLSGMAGFKKIYPNAGMILVGSDGMPLEKFMETGTDILMDI